MPRITGGTTAAALGVLVLFAPLVPTAPVADPPPVASDQGELDATPVDATSVPEPFDLDTGNSGVQLIIPAVIGATLASVSPGASDASIVIRFTFMVTHGWFDAIAPYHPTAVGIASDLGRRPADEHTDRNRNVAMLYSSYRVMNSLLPQHADDWRAMLLAAGLDPDDDSDDPSTAVGIGNLAGAAVVALRESDGMNQLGDHPDSLMAGEPYADTTGYVPVNGFGEIVDPSRWQPLPVTDGNGIFRRQTFVTPQWAEVQPLSYEDVDDFSVPPPRDSVPRGRKGRDAYKAQVDDVLAVAASLTDEQKLLAEFFDNKFRSLGFSALFVMESFDLSLTDFIHYDFLVNLAASEAGIAIWAQKARHDAVRPITAVQYQYGGERVRGWGRAPGPADPEALAWTSYLQTADHPEYPSGSAGFCAAHAQASRRFLGTDEFGWEVSLPAGSSVVEPGVVPAQTTTLSFPTWTDFEESCGLSRLHGGVHFRPAITEAQKMTRPIGDHAYELVEAHITGDVDHAGEAVPRGQPPRKPRPGSPHRPRG